MLKDFYKPLVHLRSLSFWTTGLLLDYWYFQASKWYWIVVMTLTLTVPRKGFCCKGHIVHLGRLWDCVAARLVKDDQIELELRQVPADAQFEVARHQQCRQSAA